MASTLNKIAAYSIAWIVLAALLALLWATPARASNCHQFFAHHQAVVAVPVVAQAVYYQAGIGIEQDALAAKVAKLVIGQLRQELSTGQLQQSASAPPSAIAQHCGKCHSGATPKAQVTYDGTTGLACFQVTAALRAISDDSMPKDHKLTPEQKGQVMQELLDLEADRAKPLPIQAPQQTGVLR